MIVEACLLSLLPSVINLTAGQRAQHTSAHSTHLSCLRPCPSQDVVKKLKRRKVTSIKGELGPWVGRRVWIRCLASRFAGHALKQVTPCVRRAE